MVILDSRFKLLKLAVAPVLHQQPHSRGELDVQTIVQKLYSKTTTSARDIEASSLRPLPVEESAIFTVKFRPVRKGKIASPVLVCELSVAEWSSVLAAIRPSVAPESVRHVV